MSFWDNNKDSIKSGSMSVLRGAGKATVAVSKAGYTAVKNHNNNKKGTGKDDEDDSEDSLPTNNTSINYRDPKAFPPPPRHVGAYGQPDPNPALSAPQVQQSGHYGQPSIQYGQHLDQQGQQSFQQPSQIYTDVYASNGSYSHPNQPPQPPSQLLAHDYQYSQVQQPQQPQQPLLQHTQSGQSTVSTPSDVLSYSNPYYQPPQDQKQPFPASSAQQTYPYLQSNGSHSTFQQPHSPANSNFNQPPPVAQGYFPEQTTTLPVRSLPPRPTENANASYSQPTLDPLSVPAPPVNQSYPNPPARMPSNVYTQRVDPNQCAQQNPALSEQPPVGLYQTSSVPKSGYPAYQQQSAPPAVAGYVPLSSQSQTAEYQQSSTPVVTQPPLMTVPSYGYPQPPNRTETQGSIDSRPLPTPSQSSSHLMTNRTNEETISEPKFKTNLMDFDLSKYGAPPPKARLTKEEELNVEKRKVEKQRLKQIKENSLQKAREAARKNKGTYNTALVSDNSFPSPNQLDSSKNNSATEITPLNALPSYSESESNIRQLPSVPSLPQRTNSAELQNKEPKPFNLPDISKFQPPPLAHMRTTESLTSSTQTSTGNITAVPQTQLSVLQHQSYQAHPAVEKKSPPPVPAKHSLKSPEQSTPPLIDAKAPYIRERLKSPSAPTPPEIEEDLLFEPAKLQSPESTDIESSKPKKVPPPKPPKLSKPSKPAKPTALSAAIETNSTIKVAPQKPAKKAFMDGLEDNAVMESTAKGNHIRELQARLGNLNLQ
jgi:hypothetical protein